MVSLGKIDSVCSWYFGGVGGTSTWITCVVVGAIQLGAINHCMWLMISFELSGVSFPFGHD